MRRILITGGPVHAHLDAVKIVTNRFRGGLIARLADRLAENFDCEVLYLTAPGAEVPTERSNVMVRRHSGYHDYREKVLGFAQSATDVILGAAVANLIPAQPWAGKFPSHDYEEGDIVNIPFMVTPRVIADVKRHAPRVNLFGFKLLSGAPHGELMRAAWETLVGSKATAVIANDATQLSQKYVLTREGAEHPMLDDELPDFLWSLMLDEHYRTEVLLATASRDESGCAQLGRLLAEYRAKQPGLFVTTPDGMVFGTAAVRSEGGGFWTTGRGKRELDERVKVVSVDHVNRVVSTEGSRASLNAPLLDSIFKAHPAVHAIVHGHVQDPMLRTLEWAQPGTLADSARAPSQTCRSFNVARHGCFYLLDAEGRPIV